MDSEIFEKVKNLKMGEYFNLEGSNDYCGEGYKKYDEKAQIESIKLLGDITKTVNCEFCQQNSKFYWKDVTQGVWRCTLCLNCNIGFYSYFPTMIC